jgi:2-dehydro-3-deoxy-D-pentonate aldolase
MTRLAIHGIVPPMVTPLKESGELDQDGLEGLIEHILSAGVGGLFVLGTTGEGPSLDYRLRYELVEKSGEIIRGRVPLLVGITDTSLTEALHLAQWARECGAAAVVAAPPYYFPVPQKNLAAYFQQLADHSALPVFLYNMPACTHSYFEHATLEQLTRHPNVAGLKDSSGDLDYFRQALRLREDRSDWSFLTGPEHLLARSVALGGDGGVNGGANLFPRLFVQLYEAARSGSDSEVTELQLCVESLGRIYEVGGQFAGVIQGLKAALAKQGWGENFLAAPLLPLNEDQQAKVFQILDQLRLPSSITTNSAR